MWASTVRSATTSLDATAAFVRPSATSSSTSSSRSDSDDQGVVAPSGRNERCDDGRVECRAAACHSFDGVNEIVDAQDAVFQQVPERTGADEIDGMPRLNMLRQQQDRQLRVQRSQGDSGPGAVVGHARGHSHIDDHQVGNPVGDHPQQRVGVTDCVGDLMAGLVEQPHQTFPEQHRVLGDDDLQGHNITLIRVPSPASGYRRFRTSCRPPRRSTNRMSQESGRRLYLRYSGQLLRRR